MDKDNVVKSVIKAMNVLNVIKNSSSVLTLTEITKILNMPKATVFRLLNSLIMSEYVEVDVNGGYKLGKNMIFSNDFDKKNQILKEELKETLINLRDFTGETVNLGVLYGKKVLYIDCVESKSSVRLVSNVGNFANLNSTALGKALLFNFSESEIKEIFDKELLQNTQNTIINADKLINEINMAKAKGYTYDNKEFSLSCKCVAVPIYSIDGEVLAAISVSGISSRFNDEAIDKCIKSLLKVSASIRIKT